MTFLARFTPQLHSVLRIMAGLLIMQHGTTKVLDFPASKYNDVSLTSMSGMAGLIELICGGLVVIGLFSRLAAFLLSGMAAVAYFMVHAPQGFYPLLNGGELVALYSFVFLYLAEAGPGPISVDAMRR